MRAIGREPRLFVDVLEAQNYIQYGYLLTLSSLLILAGFVAAQRGWLSMESRRYLTLNVVGASVLAVLAAKERQYGFLLLEFCWAVVAGATLLRGPVSRARRRPRPRPASRTAADPRR